MKSRGSTEPSSCTDSTALDLYEQALTQFQSYRGDPFATIDRALAARPDFVLGHLLRAMVLLTLGERRFTEQARVSVTSAEALLPRANERERGLTSAARALVDGDWAAAGALLDRVLVDHPRDMLAIQTGHLMDFYRGDALNLRNRIARVLPHWSAGMPGYSYLLGMYAFGLEECNQHSLAEETARRALALEAKDAWAVHAGVHVMEMQGRIDEGIEWLVSREADWAPENAFAFHNWWHLALFHLDRERHRDALAVYDIQLHQQPLDTALQLVDASALLWRLRLDGVELGDRPAALADVWARRLDTERGFYVFNDAHAMMAFTLARREAEAAQLMTDLDWTEAQGAPANRMMAREVGRAVCSAFRAFGQERWAEVLAQLMPVRDIAHRFGGSHAQRDVLTLTLVEAAIRGGEPALARHYLGERLVLKPESRWARRLLARAEEGGMRLPDLRRTSLSSGVTLEVAEQGRGPAVLFLHGVTDSWRSFERILPLLPAELRAIVPSQRGHGESDRPADGYDIERLADDAHALLDAAGVERATVVGHSMGSIVAQALAAAHPERVERLVLVGSATRFDIPEVRELAGAVEQLHDAVPPTFAREFQLSTIHRPIPDDFLETVVRECLKAPLRVWQQALAGILRFSADALLPRIDMPTLIVWGDRDGIAPRSEQQRLLQGIRRASLHVFEDTGHATHWERPERFVEQLLAFVRPERPAAPEGTRAPR